MADSSVSLHPASRYIWKDYQTSFHSFGGCYLYVLVNPFIHISLKVTSHYKN